MATVSHVFSFFLEFDVAVVVSCEYFSHVVDSNSTEFQPWFAVLKVNSWIPLPIKFRLPRIICSWIYFSVHVYLLYSSFRWLNRNTMAIRYISPTIDVNLRIVIFVTGFLFGYFHYFDLPFWTIIVTFLSNSIFSDSSTVNKSSIK